MDALPDATALLDSSGTILGVNHAWRMFAVDNGGRPENTGPGVNYLQVCMRSAAGGCRDAAEVLVGLRAVLAGETVDSEIEYGCPSPAARRWFRVRITPLAGPVPGALVSHVNITRQKMAEQTLAHEPAQDPLTGLANRTLFIDRLIAALTPRPGRSIRPDLGVLYVHLEDVTRVNNAYGHGAGDEVLLTTAHRLRTVVRVHDTAARLGGSHFAVIAAEISPAAASDLATRIGNALAAPHLLWGHRRVLPASVSVHLATPGNSVADVLEHADHAMNVVRGGRAPQHLTRSAPTVVGPHVTVPVEGPNGGRPSLDPAAGPAKRLGLEERNHRAGTRRREDSSVPDLVKALAHPATSRPSRCNSHGLMVDNHGCAG